MPKYTITNLDLLYRRFSIIDEPKFASFWKLENGRKIPSSAAFKTKPNEDGLSVNIASLTTPEKIVLNANEFGVAEIAALLPIGLGFECKHKPRPRNRSHAIIVGNTNPIARKLANAITHVYQF